MIPQNDQDLINALKPTDVEPSEAGKNKKSSGSSHMMPMMPPHGMTKAGGKGSKGK